MLVAINRHLIGKAPSSIGRNNDKGENLDISAHDLAYEHINRGHAFMAQHRGNRRSTNFIAAGFLALDIDKGLRLETARAHPFVQNFATIIYTTPSHTEQEHRFRIVFELEQPIRNGEDMRLALSGLISQFGGDESCKDPTRIFFGNQGCNPEVTAKKLPPEEVNTLIQRGRERQAAGSYAQRAGNHAPAAVRSQIVLSRTAPIKLTTGDTAHLQDIPARTRIYCPQHIDMKPSAVVIRTKDCRPAIYCSSCCATYFTEGESPLAQSSYFDTDWKQLLDSRQGDWRLQEVDQEKLHVDLPMLYRVKPLKHPNRHGFDYGSDEAPGVHRDADIVLVRSQTGTGKTHFLRQLVRECKDFELSVLLIGHRRTLTRAAAERLGLTNYLDEEGVRTEPTAHYSVCVDSIPKIDFSTNQYDIVILDESEQVFSHLLAATMAGDRRRVIGKFRHALQSAKQLWLLDADLGQLSVGLVESSVDTKRVHAILNRWKPSGRQLMLHPGTTPAQLIGLLLRRLREGRKCYVCSNSKRTVEDLALALEAAIPGRALRIKCITSDNSQEVETQQFIEQIGARVLDFDVVLTSPSLGTGIDITHASSQPQLAVFGIFHSLVNTHFDINQQLARVRNPVEVNVWIAEDEFAFETEPNAIKAELEAAQAAHRTYSHTDAQGKDHYLVDDYYDEIFSQVTAMQRASKNQLRSHFIQYKQDTGWQVLRAPVDASLMSEGQTLAAEGKKLNREAEDRRILSAGVLTAERYAELKRRSEHNGATPEGDAQLRRFELESFYRQSVTPELIKFDKRGDGRTAVRNMELLLATQKELEERNSHEPCAMTTDVKPGLYARDLLRRVLQSAGLFSEAGPTWDWELDATRLEPFVATIEAESSALTRIFRLTIRADYRKNPTRQLTEVLKLLGLKLKLIRRDQSGGADRSSYGIDGDKLRRVMHHIHTRAEARRRLDEPSPGDDDVEPDLIQQW